MKVKKNVKPEKNVRKSRKDIRKAKRQDKKSRKNDYYTNRNKALHPDEEVVQPTKIKPQQQVKQQRANNKASKSTKQASNPPQNEPVSVAKNIEKEKEVTKQLKDEMQKRRNRQMIEANWEEDKNIKKLEKQLKLNKRKTKSIPKTFAADGLDYLLEVCNSDNIRDVVGTEMDMDDVNDDFDEDFDLMIGGKKQKLVENQKDNKTSKGKTNKTDNPSEDEDFNSDGLDEEDFDEDSEEDFSEDEDNLQPDEEDEENEANSLENEDDLLEDESMDASDEETNIPADNSSENEDFQEDTKQTSPEPEIKYKQDIYGRLRDDEGNIIQEKDISHKYIPPAARAAKEGDTNSKIIRLKRQLKGLINRLAESNMHNISAQIEGLYSSNSRHDMNETLAATMFENLISNVPCPERLLLEHVLLVAILHANVGSEVGAFFLQRVVQKFAKILDDYDGSMEDKGMDNAVNFIAQLYNFKIFSSQLLYEVLTKLSDKFDEKHVECILNVLKNVGFTLRKDDPSTLKALIQNLQSKAAGDLSNNNPRVKFMLEILLAIKNNNVNKIPNYDTSYSEHLKKISKSFIRKGNYVTQLNISLDDLLKADAQGKWWIVGSAWAGKDTERVEKHAEDVPKNTFSQKLLALAKKQHMNTDTRKNIFCILMSAEDYMDAFEKLLHLGLKNQQEREIINVLLHCCLSEKVYNPYYSVLAQRFCDYDRRFQMIIKCSIWDKLQALVDCSPAQISNLAKLLTHLFLEKGLPISTLKIVQFGELDKITLRFMRQILLGVILTQDEDQCQEVFLKVSQSDKLKMFRESLRLFIHHFLLRNLRREGESRMDEKQKNLLEERAKLIDKILLSANEKKRKLI